jgi:hypothetical protein
MPKAQAGAISVNTGPLPGQDSRASENFSLSLLAGGSAFVWEIDNNRSDLKSITFNVAIDRWWGSDPTVHTNLRSGTSTAYPTDTDTIDDFQKGRLYIAEVKGASAPFTLRAFVGSD